MNASAHTRRRLENPRPSPGEWLAFTFFIMLYLAPLRIAL